MNTHLIIGLRLLLVIGCVAVTIAAHPARATIQEESCIEPDVEYPVPCDDDD
jgi:hypothetical protein